MSATDDRETEQAPKSWEQQHVEAYDLLPPGAVIIEDGDREES